MDVLIPYATAMLIDRGIMAGDMQQVWLYGGVMIGATNSYRTDIISPSKEFVELELLRNNPNAELRTLSHNKASDLFLTGDTFDVATFYKQFANGTKLDNGLDLGWTIKVEGIYKTTNGYSADITVTKL